MRLSGKRALMIGAATGIGRACVEDFARNGARLVVAIPIEAAETMESMEQDHATVAGGMASTE